MGDPYWRYLPAATAPAPERENIARSSFPGYFAAEASFLQSHNDLRGVPPEYLQKPVLPLRPGGYGLDDIGGIGGRPASGLGGLTSGLNIHGFPTSLEDSALISQRQDVAPGISPGISDILNETPGSLRKVNGLLTEESNILFINGLPADCTRREVGHLFRPFIGFKEIRVIHKEPRRTGDKATVLCFVEFNDGKCALTAMEALQGYKFDDKKPNSPTLRIQFAQFPFRPPSSRDDKRHGHLR